MADPTQAQLDARLNPTPVTVNAPGNGLYISPSQGNTAGTLYAVQNGKVSTLSLDSLANEAGAAAGYQTGDLTYAQKFQGADTSKMLNGLDAASRSKLILNYLKDTHGLDTTSLQTISNPADFGSAGLTLSGGLDIAGAKSLFAQKPAPATPVTVNNTPNALAPGVKPGVQPATVGPQPGLTALPNNGGAAPVVPSGAAPANPDVNPNVAFQFQGSQAIQPPVPPPTTAIGNPVPAPALNGAPPMPNLPTPAAPTAAATFTTSLTATLEAQKQALQAQADKQAADFQSKIDTLNKEQSDFTAKQDTAMAGIKTATDQEIADKKSALELEKQRVNDNYNANQQLINEMDSLLTTGNQIIADMKATTGLSSIMNPRISQTMSDITARAGVIQAVLAARNNQIGVAQSQLKTTVDTLSSIAGDQINYYKALVDYYASAKTEDGKQLVSLKADQKGYLDNKITQLESDLKNTQATADLVSKAMLNPDTAQAYAQAGVSLNDSPQQIAQKLAVYDYAKEVSENANTMAKAGYSSSPIAGVPPVTTTDSKGVKHNWYKQDSSGGFTIGDTRFDANGKPIVTAPNGGTPFGSPSAADRSAVFTALGQHPDLQTSVDQSKLQSDPTYFYWVKAQLGV